jgi:hypothetical protein
MLFMIKALAARRTNAGRFKFYNYPQDFIIGNTLNGAMS